MTTPVLLDPLAEAENYEALVGTPPAGLDINALLEAASDLVRGYCGWHIAPRTTETVRLDGSGGHSMMLPTLELVDVEAVSDADVTIDPLDIQWSRDGFLRRAGCWTVRLRGVEVTMNHGFDPIPPGLVALVCTIAARAGASPAGIVREQVGPASLTYSQVGSNVAGGSALLQHEMAYLAQYTIPGRP